MFKSHYRAATGCVCVETREESRLLLELRLELTDAEIGVMTAPDGAIYIANYDERRGRVTRTKEPVKNVPNNMTGAYDWAAGAPGRVLVVYDWHLLCNAPGHWRNLMNCLPAVRAPGSEGNASLIVFVGPAFNFSSDNPLAGTIPKLHFGTPNRAALQRIANGLMELPAGEEGEKIVDAICGLPAEIAEQCCAENLVANNAHWNATTLSNARQQAIKSGGLEIWSPATELGGLGGLKTLVETEVVPWIRDEQLAIRRILCAGLPGCGKSYFARWLAFRLGAQCARLSFPGLKAGIVGQSEQNLRRAFRTIDAMAAESPLVVVLDEIDKVASEGADGGTSAGMFAETLSWLQESKTLCVVVATLNRLDKLDSAMESRFACRLFFDLPSLTERRDVIQMHYRKVGIATMDTAGLLADITEGFSNREISESIIPSIARLSARNPTPGLVQQVVDNTTPSSKTQKEQIAKMKDAAKALRHANDPEDTFEASPMPERFRNN